VRFVSFARYRHFNEGYDRSSEVYLLHFCGVKESWKSGPAVPQLIDLYHNITAGPAFIHFMNRVVICVFNTEVSIPINYD